MIPKVIAVSGGIGCGKSVICQILKHLGYPVYDCDVNAKILMDNSDNIKKLIASKISSDVIKSNNIDRKKLGEIVFKDSDALKILNNIVHSEVRKDISMWINSQSNNDKIFIETAILYQSGIDNMVDEVWDIYAPIDLRVNRVMKRNNLRSEDVIARIKSQQCQYIQHKNNITIVNDNVSAIIPQILKLL